MVVRALAKQAVGLHYFMVFRLASLEPVHKTKFWEIYRNLNRVFLNRWTGRINAVAANAGCSTNAAGRAGSVGPR